MSTSLFDCWSEILTVQEALLDELAGSLSEERAALLENELDALKKAILKKDKATRKLELLEPRLQSMLLQSAKALGGQPAKSVRELFERFERFERKELQARRGQVASKAKSIRRHNEFNQNCIGIYSREVQGVMSILNLSTRKAQTYTQRGRTTGAAPRQGRLISRSL